MIFQENCTFSSITTFKVGGPVRFLADCETVDDVVAALLECKQRTLPYVVMGEGSNILGSDEGYSGVIIRIRIQGQTYSECVGGTVLVEAGAGVPWDAVVEGALVRRRFGPLARTRYGCCTPHSGQSSFVETKGYQHTRQRLSFPALNTRIEQ